MMAQKNYSLIAFDSRMLLSSSHSLFIKFKTWNQFDWMVIQFSYQIVIYQYHNVLRYSIHTVNLTPLKAYEKI